MADLLSLDLVKEGLDRKLRQVKKNDIIMAIYYHNGKCLKVEGMVSRIDDTSRILKIVNTRIPFDDLYYISGESDTCNK